MTLQYCCVLTTKQARRKVNETMLAHLQRLNWFFFYIGPEKNDLRTQGSPSEVRDMISASQIETLKFDVSL